MKNKNRFIRLGAGLASLCMMSAALSSCGIFGNGDGTVSGELGNSVRDLGDGVGNAVEDVGDAVGNAAEGR